MGLERVVVEHFGEGAAGVGAIAFDFVFSVEVLGVAVEGGEVGAEFPHELFVGEALEKDLQSWSLARASRL
jgi:hypothetical protein